MNISKVKFLNFLSTLVCSIMITLLTVFIYLVEGSHVTTPVLFLGISLFIINPIYNLLRQNKKIIINPIYHILLIISASFNTYVSIKSIIMFFQYYNIDGGHTAKLYFFSPIFLIVIIPLLILFIISFFLKKEVVIQNHDITKITFLIIAIISLLSFRIESNMYISVIEISLAIFSLIFILKPPTIQIRSQMQLSYIIILLMCILTTNYISAILIVNLYFQLDNNSLSI